ncbi:GINS complex subunit 3 [Tieghemostelium lacteum]|uniref:GINS complex subunit 3 n=1 Tax=Tieghemostelium lacteum TaxID=361077 RepID=A0A151Z509_TIELA|nr:GINS complex subunit 3 [Tieghemostelium lacteum]|eukprot:KYQ88884.1 GINS complex subunit 3 [Tieghemostelium lacteum]
MTQSKKDYFDIDDILAEEEKIPCTFQHDAYHLGLLDTGSVDLDLKRFSTIHLAFWLSYPLAKRLLVSLDYPMAYQDEFKNKLIADPKVISMRKFQYYDIFGIKLANLFDNPKISTLLFKTFRDRFLDIYNQSLHLRNADISKSLQKYTVVERFVFLNGYNSSIAYDDWKNRRGEKLKQEGDNDTNNNNNNNRSTFSNNNKDKLKRKRFTDMGNDD